MTNPRPSDAPFELPDRDVGHAGGSGRPGSDWVDAVISGRATPFQAHGTALPDGMSDLMTSVAAHPIGAVPSSDQARSESTVPLPTSLSLFGSAVLTLGLFGVFSSARRRLPLEAGYPFGSEYNSDPAGAAPPARFQIEARGERGCQVRHTGSARVTIDMIADLLNDGWEMVRISDPNGVPIDYDDVIAASNRERNAS